MKKRGTGVKMTLAAAAEHNDYLTFHCEAQIPTTRQCGRRATMDALEALAKWGPDISSMSFRCAVRLATAAQSMCARITTRPLAEYPPGSPAFIEA